MGEFCLRQRKGSSFETDNPEALCRWLGDEGFVYADKMPGEHEFARMERAGELAVVYKKGTIVCQGGQADLLVLLLEKGAQDHPWPV